MKLTRKYLLAVVAFLGIKAGGQNLVGDNLRLKPSSVPVVCNNGDMRIDSGDSNKLKVCRANIWTAVIDATTAVTTANSAGTAAFSLASGAASFSVTSGTAAFASTASSAGTASFSTTASFAGTASTSGTASFATTASFSGTASTSGTAAFAALAAIAGTASVVTAFASTPSPCSANQFALGISTLGNLTCAQVGFQQLTAFATILQGGTNNNTLSTTAGGILYMDGSKVMNMGAGTTGQAVRSQGSGTPIWRAIGTTITKITTASGVYTVPTGAVWLRVRLVGGAGGGAGTGSSGSGGNGNNGAATTFVSGALSLSAGAGIGATSTGGAGGTASGCDVNMFGSQGGPRWANVIAAIGGYGGQSVLAGAGQGGEANGGGGGSAATNSGSGGGGSGSTTTTINSGAGGGSGSYCEKIITSLAANYTYSVGGAGGGGGAGTSGLSGGNGAAGIIIIEEFY